jgi:hypothetical protein
MEDLMGMNVKSSGVEFRRKPPCFGEGRSWRVRQIEWFTPDPNDPTADHPRSVAIAFKGTQVHEKLHAAYWEARDVSLRAIAAYGNVGITPPYSYFLFDKNDVIVGYGEFDLHDDADDMAWISCLFLEMGLRAAFPMPGDVTDEDATQYGGETHA